jgi:hypothetical protein
VSVTRAALLVVVVAAGCGSHRSVLDEGVGVGPQATRHKVSAAETVRAGRISRPQWRQEIAKRAREAPRERFANLAPSLLRQRLAEAARRYDFEIVSVRLLRPRRLAPEVVVRTKHYLRLARSTGKILTALNPRLPARDDRHGWEYEAFYFEVRDEHDVPFLLAFTAMRGSGAEGGQWARSERLFPFPHG